MHLEEGDEHFHSKLYLLQQLQCENFLVHVRDNNNQRFTPTGQNMPAECMVFLSRNVGILDWNRIHQLVNNDILDIVYNNLDFYEKYNLSPNDAIVLPNINHEDHYNHNVLPPIIHAWDQIIYHTKQRGYSPELETFMDSIIGGEGSMMAYIQRDNHHIYNIFSEGNLTIIEVERYDLDIKVLTPVDRDRLRVEYLQDLWLKEESDLEKYIMDQTEFELFEMRRS